MEPKGIKILVVDDEVGLRDLLAFELGGHGYTVVTAQDGEEAIERLQREKFQLVISDVKMPKRDGMELLEAAKRIDPQVEVIMATGFGTIETAVGAMKMGAYDFIQKPYNMTEIQALVEKALEKSDLKSLIALYESSQAIFASLQLDRLLPVMIDLALKVLRADDASLMLVGDDGKLYLAISSGLPDTVQQNVRTAIGERVAGKVAEWKTAVIVTGSLKDDSRFGGIEGREGIRSAMVCPLVGQEGVLGVLNVNRVKMEEPYGAADIRSAAIFTAQIAQAVENARLHHSLADKIEELKRAYAELEGMKSQLIMADRLASLGQMAAGVAHEINNPLTSVIGYTDLLLQSESLSLEEREDLKVVQTQARRCRDIVQNLLKFARRRDPQKVPVDLAEVLKETMSLVEYEIKSSGVTLLLEEDPALPPVSADPSQLKQVFLNLVSNARQACEGQPESRITLRAQAVDGVVRVSCEDNGCGIAPGNLDRIFDPFFTTKPVGKGTGLGLSISYGIVKDHGGTLRVSSVEGTGTTFTIDFPFDAQVS